MLLGLLANWHRAMFFEGRGAAGFLDTGRLLGTDSNRKIPSMHLPKAGRVEPH
jgi:hypothetical protein